VLLLRGGQVPFGRLKASGTAEVVCSRGKELVEQCVKLREIKRETEQDCCYICHPTRGIASGAHAGGEDSMIGSVIFPGPVH
jgi:hypothetical protein